MRSSSAHAFDGDDVLDAVGGGGAPEPDIGRHAAGRHDDLRDDDVARFAFADREGRRRRHERDARRADGTLDEPPRTHHGYSPTLSSTSICTTPASSARTAPAESFMMTCGLFHLCGARETS